MIVYKFGGTSVGSADAIRKIKSIIDDNPVATSRIIVVSALSGTTDTLIRCAQQASQNYTSYKDEMVMLIQKHHQMADELLSGSLLETTNQFLAQQWEELTVLLDSIYHLNEMTPRVLDKIVAYGELMSSTIIYNYFSSKYESVVWADSRKFIKTNSGFGKATIDKNKTNALCKSFFSEIQKTLYIAPGFIASDDDGNTTTLGRGGSDYTAALIGAALESKEVVIWTDVSGIYSANPNLVSQAFCLPELQYEEAMELAHFGAKVLYPPTIQPLYEVGATLYIKNTFEPHLAGTKITANISLSHLQQPVTGITYRDHVTLLTIEGAGMVGVSGMAQRIFGALAQEKINIIFITQASSEHSICIGIDASEQALAQKALHRELSYEFEYQRIKPLIWETQVALVAVVGNQMKNATGLSGQLFSALGKNNINIRAIAQGASERNISCVINAKDAKKAVSVLHERFFENQIKVLNLIVLGVGTVGSYFLDLLQKQKSYLLEERNLDIRIVGLANSKKILLNAEGINLNNWKENLISNGKIHQIEDLIHHKNELNVRNLVVIDNTASEDVAMKYDMLLAEKIAIITCNKVACSSNIEYYKKLKSLVKSKQTPFLYETNVGAGLPIIDTLKNLITTGDRVHKMKAVLSGSLNFIFNTYNGTTPFAEVVKQAQLEGYTEPDPRLDLSGGDVIRKIIILIRESGNMMEQNEVINAGFLDEKSQHSESIADFYDALANEEIFYKTLYEKAHQKGNKLKFVASYEDGVAKVGLEEIPSNHPFYHLDGKDNIVLFFTDRYQDNPLLIKGAGAGASVTASGIFADVLRLSTI